MKRALVVSVAAVGAAISVSACTAPRPGAAATVGNGRISVDDLVGRVNAVLAADTTQADTDANRQAIQREVLGALIGDRVDDALAAKYNVTVSASDVEQVISSALTQNQIPTDAQLETALLQQAHTGYDGLESAARDSKEREAIATAIANSIPVTDAELQADYNANISSFATADVAIIQVPTLDEALSVQGATTAANFATQVAAHSTDAKSKANKGDLGSETPTDLGPQLSAAVFQTSTKAGDILGPVAVADGFDIVQVKTIQYTPFSAARAQLLSARRDPSSQSVATALGDQRIAEGQKLGVWVNPRFGSWDGAKSLAGTSTGGTVSAPTDLLSIPIDTSTGTSSTDLSGLTGGTG